MSNVESTATYTSSTGFTTANVTRFFTDSDQNGMGALKAVAKVTMALETAFGSTTAKSLYVPLFPVQVGTFIPTQYLVQLTGVGAFASATVAATAQLSWTLGYGVIPTTVAIGGSAGSILTPTPTVTAITAAGTAGAASAIPTQVFAALVSAGSPTVAVPNTGLTTLILAASTVGLSVPATVGQTYQGQVQLTGTTPTSISAANMAYLIISSSVAFAADLTVTGGWRFYIYGNQQVNP